MVPPKQLTAILGRISSGDGQAREELFEVAYRELREIAQRLMASEKHDHTLQPTALVHEAAIRLLGSQALEQAADRSYFFGAMSKAMRRVLVDHARASKAQRRGAGHQTVPLSGLIENVEKTYKIDLLSLDDALSQLDRISPRQSEIVVRRFFGGFEMQEIADQLEVSLSTIHKDWRVARAWLRHRLAEENS